MNKRKVLILSAAVIVSAGVLYAVSSGYVRIGVPVQNELEATVTQTDDMTTSSAQTDEVEKLRQQIEQLNAELEKAKEEVSSSSVIDDTATSAASTIQSSPVTAIAFNKTTDLTMNVGETNRRTAITTPSGQPVTYTSSNPEVATVSADGNVTCLTAGKTVITAMSGEMSVSYNLTVAEALPVAQKTDTAKSGNSGSPLANYAVTVSDKATPAVRSGGTDWPITTYYFIAADGTKLGRISGKAYTDIMEKYRVKSATSSEWLAPGSGGDWVTWFADVFNEYRGIAGSSTGKLPDNQNSGDSSGSSKGDTNFNATALASEAFALINKERVKAGLNEVDMDSTMMDLAAMRSEELVEKYDHVRPNGTRMSTEYRYAEIINRRANTASIAVSSWMGSSGHKDIILTEKYNYAGIGCYKGDDGTVYWCMLFSK